MFTSSPVRTRLFRFFGMPLTLIVVLSGLLPAALVSAQTGSGVTVTASLQNDVSRPLRSMQPAGRRQGPPAVRPVRPVPRPKHAATKSGNVQSQPGTASAPATSLNFDGVGQGFSGPSGTFTVSAAPPDTNGAAGPSHYVQTVNTDFAIFNKSGSPVYGPVPINTLWSGFGGLCQTDNDGDPSVLYDQIAGRWVITQFAVSGANGTSAPFLLCVAVSTTGDPTGSYYRYSFTDANFPDYPKFGVWPDGYYFTTNEFNAAGTTFLGGRVAALDRAKMTAGQPATQQAFNLGTSYGGILPAGLDGPTLPPAGSPNQIVGLGAAANTLASWKFHVDWTTPASSTLTGPATLSTAAYSEACGGGTCIPQSGTTQTLDSLADRLMYRLAYRNFGDHEAMVVNHSVTAGTSAGVRWYELRLDASQNASIYQQGTYAPDGNYRWMGSIAMDRTGNMALGFSISGSSIHPGIHYTGRLVGDALGQMTQGEASIIDGAGSQTGQSLSRWGDYSSMSVDPADDCTFWYTNEYIPSNGAFNWKSRIGSFKYTSCGTTPPANDFSLSVTPSSLSIPQASSGAATVSTAVTSGSTQTVSLSVAGVPAGASASFSPASVTAGGSSTLTISAGTAAAGTYSLTVTGTGTSATHSASLALTVTSSGGGGTGITNGGFETGSLSGWTAAGTASAVTGGHSGSYAARVGSTSPTNGDSSVGQTFTAPSGTGQLSVWYKVVCPDTLTYDWATATLKDNTAGTTATVLAKTCTNNGAWQQATSAVTPGHSYTLTLVSHDDNYVGDATYTLYDDVVVQ